MKIKRSTYNAPRRANPLTLILIVLLVIVALLIGWFWVRGGEKPLTRVEKPVAAERLGH